MTGQRRAGAASLAEAMSELQIIESALQQAARRRRWARALRGLWRGPAGRGGAVIAGDRRVAFAAAAVLDADGGRPGSVPCARWRE